MQILFFLLQLQCKKIAPYLILYFTNLFCLFSLFLSYIVNVYIYFLEEENSLIFSGKYYFIAYIATYRDDYLAAHSSPIIFPLQPFRSSPWSYHAPPSKQKRKKKSFNGKFTRSKRARSKTIGRTVFHDLFMTPWTDSSKFFDTC